jgi:hypothetical protein
MEDLAWANQKREGRGDMIDLFICACFIQGLHDDGIKTMVKTKGNVNTPMAQLVEVAVEEESAIKSERFKRYTPEKGTYNNQGQRAVERKEVRTAAVTSYRCKKTGHMARNCRAPPECSREEQVTQRQAARSPGNSQLVGKQEQGQLPKRPMVKSPIIGCDRTKGKDASIENKEGSELQFTKGYNIAHIQFPQG